jgi:hypothetical protein
MPVHNSRGRDLGSKMRFLVPEGGAAHPRLEERARTLVRAADEDPLGPDDMALCGRESLA